MKSLSTLNLEIILVHSCVPEAAGVQLDFNENVGMMMISLNTYTEGDSQ
jgi:hypothetical protein